MDIKEVTLTEFSSQTSMYNILECRIIFMFEPHVWLCKWVRHVKIKHVFVIKPHS